MLTWFKFWLAGSSHFMPHGACYLWLPSILWLHIVSDSIIALAYYSIPFALFYFVKKRTDLAYRWVFVLFAVFICLCGTTHLISIWTIWHPDYWLDGMIKLATALVSIVTALLVWPLIPKLLKLPSPQALQTSETYLRAIFNATPDAMLISDEQGIITMVNQQAGCLLGYPMDELLGQSIDTLVPGRFKASHPALRAQFAASPVVRPMGMGRVVKALRKDGHEFDVEISLSPIQTEQGLFFASALRDVTERIQAQKILQDKERMLSESQRIAHVGSWSLELSTGRVSWSDETYQIYGVKPESFKPTGKTFIDLVHPDDRAAMKKWVRDCRTGHQPGELDFRILLTDGSVRHVRGSGGLQYDEMNRPRRMVGSAQDITERKKTDQVMDQLKAMIDISLDGFWIVDVKGKLLQVNEAYAKISGYSIDELMAMHIDQLEATEGFEQVQAHIAKIIQQGYDQFETRHRRKDGHIIDVEVSAAFLAEFQQFCVFCRDITDRKRSELDLRIAAIAFESQEAMVITDAESVILRINKAFSESTGYSEKESLGQKISLLKSGRHEAAFYRAMWESILATGSWQGEIWDRRKNGEIYPKWLSITAVKDKAGLTTHYIGMHTDITERKSAEKQIEELAFYDPLTKLPNRRLLQERLKHGIHVEQRDGKQFGLLMLDLDRFKAVNDSLGHLAGDELLQQVATRISQRLRDVDMVARLGGDEFIVLLEDIAQPEDAARVAEDIVADLSKLFCLPQSSNVQIGVSIGISLYPQHGDTPEQLMDHADAALYQAKDAGRGCFAYFSEDLTLAARERIALETRLRLGIGRGELRVFFQPQVDLVTGLIVGAEALVRWQDPENGLVPPLRFIPIAEETGLIVEVGDWVLRETCKIGRQWLDRGLPPIALAVNVSPHQFRRGNIEASITQALEETGYPAELLELEITESSLMGNQDNTINLLNSLRAKGIRFAMDDFGTGYSSLAYLKRFPLDMLKIDKSFIDEIPFHQDDMEIAATIIAMGHILGFKVLAEGVETPEQLAFLQEKKCDMFQGYIKSKPLPEDEFSELLSQQRA